MSEILKKKIERLKKINNELENQVETKTREIYQNFQEIQEIYDSLPSCLLVVDESGNILQRNSSASRILQPNQSSLSEILTSEQVLKISSNTENTEVRIYDLKIEEKNSFICHYTPLGGSGGMKFLLVINEITAIKKEELKRAELQNQLMQSSFKEGMAENAISILHNIGNVLTGMVGLLSGPKTMEIANKGIDNLDGLIDNLNSLKERGELEDFLKKPDKQVGLIDFLKSINTDFLNFYKEMDTCLKSIQEKTTHIGSIISVQQQYAKLKQGIKNTLTLGQLVEDCLMINEDKLLKPHIKLHKTYDKSLTVKIEKNGFIQVLSNVIVNAVESIETKIEKFDEYKSGNITISSYIEGDSTILELKDDGHGFSKEVGEKLFKFGFSTKQRSSGFGLHNCFNFMRKNDGNFEISSDGEGKGALIKITIN